METKRLFISIPLPDSMKETLSAYMKQEMRRIKQNLHPTKAQNLHITTLFLGDIAVELLPAIQLAITRGLQTCVAFDLPFDRICFMPNTTRPRMIWAEFAKSEAFSELVWKLKTALEPIVGMIEEERKPIPHVTLIRLKHFYMKEKIKLPELTLSPLHIGSCELMESHLSNLGPEYQCIQQFSL